MRSGVKRTLESFKSTPLLSFKNTSPMATALTRCFFVTGVDFYVDLFDFLEESRVINHKVRSTGIKENWKI